MRLINADALIETISDHVTTVSCCPTVDWSRGKTQFKKQCLEDINNAPTYINVDSDFFAVLICAVRYCLGRRTYMPSLVTGWIMYNMHGKIPKKDLNIMLEDILGQRQMGLGDPCDVETWNRFDTWLCKEKEGDD